MNIKTPFFTSLDPEIAAQITALAPPEFQIETHPIDLSDEKLIPLVIEAEFLILFPGRLSTKVLREAKSLKLIQLLSAGYEHMDLELCAALAIPVANNGGANAIDAAEHTLALILGLYRILYVDEQPAPAEFGAALELERVSLAEALSRADILSLHVPLTPGTRGLIGIDELAKMRPTALLINTCRGSVIDQSALVTALRQGQILGAGLDVFSPEPLPPDHPLLELPNVLLTPHIAGITRDTWCRRGRFAFANLRRVWEGNQPLAQIGLS